jgi:hypothetical protein
MHGTCLNENKLVDEAPSVVHDGDILKFGAEVRRGTEIFPACAFRVNLEFSPYRYDPCSVSLRLFINSIIVHQAPSHFQTHPKSMMMKIAQAVNSIGTNKSKHQARMVPLLKSSHLNARAQPMPLILPETILQHQLDLAVLESISPATRLLRSRLRTTFQPQQHPPNSMSA